MTQDERTMRAVSTDGGIWAIRIEPDLIGGVFDGPGPYWEIWNAETFETLNTKPIPDTGQDAEAVLAQWELEVGRGT